MSGIIRTLPPRPTGLGEDDGLGKMKLRTWQLTLTLLTVLITTWFITLGPIPGIVAVVTAKHVLVAILLMGLGVDAPTLRGSDSD
jgi:hypothetical protein